MTLVQIELGDRDLLAAVGAAMQEAARKSGDWLVCRPGCTQCCMGPFAITELDALRLRWGLEELRASDPDRADRVEERVRGYIAAIGSVYPGDAETGELFDEDALPESMDGVPCPALDPANGTCDVYSARPITCRTFGPVTRTADEHFAACELCYEGASEEQMAACAVEIDRDGREAELLAELEKDGRAGLTIVAYALQRDVSAELSNCEVQIGVVRRNGRRLDYKGNEPG